MDNITIKAIRSDLIYEKIMNADQEKKEDIYRYELMKPFEEKWAMYHCPLKAKEPNGYDVVMASEMLGNLAPRKIDDTCKEWIQLIKSEELWKNCIASIRNSLQKFTEQGIEPLVREYLFSIQLMNPESPYSIMADNYCGEGGIPGYMFGSLVPSEYTMKRLPIALAHETNHNVRFQFQKWRNDISLGEYMVSEGLAENFATFIYGEENIGPWVSKTDMSTLNEYIKPLIEDALEVQGFENIVSYMYGDDLAKMQNYSPVGLPYCAGYACGYHLVKYYLHKTGKSVVEASILPASEILTESKEFWS